MRVYIYIYLHNPPPTHTYVYLLHTDSQMRGGVPFIHSGPAVTRTVLAWKDVDQHNKYGSCPYSRKASAQLSSPSCVWLSVTPWTAACHASLSLTISRSLPKFMFIASEIKQRWLCTSPSEILGDQKPCQWVVRFWKGYFFFLEQ